MCKLHRAEAEKQGFKIIEDYYPLKGYKYGEWIEGDVGDYQEVKSVNVYTEHETILIAEVKRLQAAQTEHFGMMRRAIHPIRYGDFEALMSDLRNATGEI